MKAFMLSLVVVSGCAQVVPAQINGDPYPAAENFVWYDFLKMPSDNKPTTQYVDKICADGHTPGIDSLGFCIDGQFEAWDRIVVINRPVDILPSQSFLCYGYMLAHYSPNVHDPNLNYDMFYIGDQFIYGAAVDLCQQELRDYDYKVE